MSWKFWKKKPPPRAAASPPADPFISLEVADNGALTPFVFVPPPRDDEHAAHIANNLAITIYLLTTGQLLPLLQQGVVNGAQAVGAEGVAYAVLAGISRLIEEKGQQGKPRAGRLVVRPTEVFAPPKGGNND